MKAVFFDADDTLWELNVHYHNAKEEIARRIAERFGIEFSAAYEKVSEANLRRTKTMGFGRHSFPTAMAMAYSEIAKQCGVDVTPQNIIDAYIIADSMVFDQLPEPKPGVETTISTLNRLGYICRVITMGDEIIQSSKIYRSGIWRYVNDTIIVPDKCTETYINIQKAHPEIDQFIMVGNSMRSDIKPALEAGWHAIYIPSSTWAFDHAEMDGVNTERLYRVENIKEIIPIVTGIYGEAERV